MAGSNDVFSVFQLDAWVGKTWKEIEDAGIFGKRVFKNAKKGKWNAAHRLEFAGGMGKDENPYLTEVGFLKDRLAAYFLIQKQSLQKGLRLNEAEIQSQLYKIASAGEWSVDSDDSTGKLYQYTVGKKKRVLLGYRTPNFRQVLVYSPKVSPNLDGKTSAPTSLLR